MPTRTPRTLLRRPFPLLYAVLIAAMSTSGRAHAQDVFAGDFETGSVAPWSDAFGLTERLFRFSDLDLRDPHIFVDASPLGCPDLTDVPFLVFPALNPTLETAITTDGDGDGLLDASTLLVFRGGLSTLVLDGFVDTASGICNAPLETTTCQVDGAAVRTELRFDAGAAGPCLVPLAGTTSGYTPAIAEPAAPCFVTQAADLVVELQSGGMPVAFPLRQAQVSSTLVGSPIGTLATGLLSGFVSEADADLIILPPELGGGVLSALLPGGTGSCATGDDRDMLDGDSGWWFYFNFEAGEVPVS